MPLTDLGGGQYAGPLAAAPPGNWEIVVRAETLPGGAPGVPLRGMLRDRQRKSQPEIGLNGTYMPKGTVNGNAVQRIAIVGKPGQLP